MKSKLKVRIEGTIENKSCSTTRVDPKTVFNHYPGPKNRPLGPQKAKNDYTTIQNKIYSTTCMTQK